MIAAIVGILVGLMLPPVGGRDVTHRFPPPRSTTQAFAKVAGDYYYGHGRGDGESLKILPDGRYSFVSYDRESGYAKNVSGCVVLSPTKQVGPIISRVFVPVPWGPRSYLIPLERMEEFCNAVIAGKEPRAGGRGRFYLNMSSNVLARVAGVPTLPKEWASYLKEHLLVGTIVEVCSNGDVRIDLGSRDSVQISDVFAVQGANRTPRLLQVISVEERFCLAAEGDDRSDGDERLQAGRKVVKERLALEGGGKQ